MVADIVELEEMDVSELHARRLHAKEVLTPQRSGNCMFPVANGTVKIFGREQRLRTSTLTRERQERGEEQEVLRGESDGLSSLTPFQDDSTRDDEEAKSDSGLLQEISFIAIMRNPESNCTCRQKSHFLFHLKYIDVTRTTHTSLGVLLEKHIEDY